LGTGVEQPYRLSTLDGLAEDAMQSGIVVLVAAGNDAYDPKRNIITPPASAPSVITVGGLNDQNSMNMSDIVAYHSNFGKTIDGIVKPEIVAPGIWIAAPILPGSPLFQKAKLLWDFKDLDLKDQRKAVETNIDRLGMEKSILDLSDDALQMRIKTEISREKLIAPHYQHVDGTSFSSPIVGSVIAQMLEANSSLTPSVVKEILIDTAISLPGIPRGRQGYGMVHPRAAVEAALMYSSATKGGTRLVSPSVKENVVSFTYKDDTCRQVTIAGSFNGWEPEDIFLERRGVEQWVGEITVNDPGTYSYKLVIDGYRWIADPLCFKNAYDGFGGKNSSFEIHCFGDTSERLSGVAKGLESNRPSLPVTDERLAVLKAFDSILEPESVSQCNSLRDYFHGTWKSMLETFSKPHKGLGMSVHLLYNMGTVIRTDSMTIGFDLVSCRHVLGVYWKTDDALIEQLVNSIDVLFVSHRHADHLDVEIAERMVKAGKLVIGPNEASDVLPRGVLALSAKEEREIFGIGVGNGALKIVAHEGDHVRGRKTPMRVYEVTLDGVTTIVHSGDHNFEKTPISFSPGLQLLIASVEGYPGKVKAEQSIHTLLTHNAELGHTNELGRFGFAEAYSIGKKAGKEPLILTWGESIDL
jgi:serine protease AprX